MTAQVELNIDSVTLSVFIALFAVFTFLGFYGYKWRQGDLKQLHEWALAGRKLGWFLVWFLLGADLFTAYTFVAVPSSIYARGSLFFYAVPYVAWGFAVALITMPKLWEYAKEHNLVTASDFVKFRFGSKSLSIAVALLGSVAELPYIALQIVGMQAILTVLLAGLTGEPNKMVEEIALVVAFVILAAFTWTSGLRGATLTGVLKDVLVWITVIGTIVTVYATSGGLTTALQHLDANKYAYLNPTPGGISAYFSLAIGSAFALYLYPHAINASLSSDSSRNLKLSTALMPIYGIGLALIALFGILIYAYPPALAVVKQFNNGALTTPALIAAVMPDWFVGLAFAAIFVGGLVPASIMAIGVGNLIARNVVGELTAISPQTELNIAKWVSLLIKFIALGFVFVVPPTYAIALQLLGGIIIVQTFPAVFIALFSDKLHPKFTLAGLIVGLVTGVLLTLYANKFGPISVTTTTLGPLTLYIGLVALGINLLVTLVGTAVAYASGWRPKQVKA